MTMRLLRKFKLAGAKGDNVHPYLNKDGAFLGPRLALLEKDERGRWRARPAPVLKKILSEGYGSPVDMSRRVQSLEVVARALNDNNPALAAIALVQAQFPPLPDDLEKGADAHLTQPRVPAGSAGAGQWTSGGAVAAAGAAAEATGGVAETATAIGEALIGVGPTVGRAGLAVGTSVGGTLAGAALATAGVVFVPTNASLASEGGVTGQPGLNFRFSEMRLTLIQRDDQGGARLLFSGMPGTGGYYRNADGTIIGRAVGLGFELDHAGVAAMSAAQPESRTVALVGAKAKAPDEPKLCPDPSPDRPSGMSARAAAYQQWITGLPLGEAILFNGAHFDGCDTATGTLLEAKGPGLQQHLDENGNWKPYFVKKGKVNLDDQITRQSRAAGGRLVEWYVAEPRVAEYIREFAWNNRFYNIKVSFTPPRTP